jgi:hypothetical protein
MDQLLCDECDDLQANPYAAGTIDRFQTRGIGERTRPDGPPIAFKFWMCVLCRSLWTEEIDPNRDPACFWTCTGFEPDASLS